MRNERNETMIFYLIKRSISSSLFHFVISALTLMFSLNELMLRSFFIAMYKNLWCFEFDRFVDFLHERNNSAEQLSEFDYFSQSQDTTRNDVVV